MTNNDGGGETLMPIKMVNECSTVDQAVVLRFFLVVRRPERCGDTCDEDQSTPNR